MKRRYVQKMLTMVLTAAMICSSVPVAAETVSQNETAVAVDTAVKLGTAEEADVADIAADQTPAEEKEGNLHYRIYQVADGSQYVEITGCDEDA